MNFHLNMIIVLTIMLLIVLGFMFYSTVDYSNYIKDQEDKCNAAGYVWESSSCLKDSDKGYYIKGTVEINDEGDYIFIKE